MNQFSPSLRNLLIFTTLLFSVNGICQTSPLNTSSIIGASVAAGDNASGATGNIEYSIGQVFYAHTEQSDYQITQGMQQPEMSLPPVAGTISANQTVCYNAIASDITLTGHLGTVQWQVSSDNINFSTISGQNSTILPSSAMGPITATRYFRAAVTNETSLTAFSVSVKIESPSTTWNGNSWSNGIPTSATSAIFDGNYQVSSDIYACSITVINNAVVTVPSGFNVIINGAITVNSGSFTLDNNTNLIQSSDAINSGNINIKRESSALLRLDYTLWSSPVTNPDQYLQSFSPSTSPNRFYTYTTASNLYTAIASPSVTNFSLGSGYLIRMPNDASSTIRSNFQGVFTGVPNNGRIAVKMINEGEGKRFNLIGNPYPSTIKITKFVADNISNITGTLYFWRKTNNPSNPSYCVMLGDIFISNGDSQAANPDETIQVGQGFFVEATNSATSVIFNNSQRSLDNENHFFRTKAEDKNTVWLNATSATGAFSQMALGYSTNATLGVDPMDGKYYNDGAIALNSSIEDKDYVIQSRPLPFDGTDEVPLHFKATNAGDYTIAIDRAEGLFTSLTDIILKDNLNGTETNLKSGSYTFTAPAGQSNTRFSIKYQKTLGTTTPKLDETNIIAFDTNGKIVIKSDVNSIADVQIYDIKGSLLFEKTKVNANETSIESNSFGNQLVIAKITTDDKKVFSKKIAIR